MSALPYIFDREQAGVGEWFNRPGRLAQGIFLATLIVIAALTIRGGLR